MKTNKEIFEARIALAKIANADLPLPLIMNIAPIFEECEGVIEKAMRLESDEAEQERYLNGVRDLPSCVIPAMPEIRLSYVDYKSLEGIIKFEEVAECLKS